VYSRVRTAKPISQAVCDEILLAMFFCSVKKLGADVNQRGEHGFTALTAATFGGNHDTLRYLVEEIGADVDSPDNLSRTPLYSAASMNRLAFVRVLLQLGADIDRTDNGG
jgi:ankyrin repeat protein